MNEERNDNLTAANAKGAESFKVRGMRIGTMNLPFHGPRLCRRPTAATIHGELQRSRNLHCDHEPPWSSPSPMPVPTRSGLEEMAGDTKAIWNLVIGAFFGIWGLAFGASPRPVHGQ